jgi:hypothetical protein
MAAGTTVPEPNTANGEVAWIASGSYPIDDLCTSNGSVYSCFRAHSGRTVRLEADPGYWLRKGPTDRMAPFDDYSVTKSRGKGAITFVLTPGCVNSVSVYGPEGATYSLVVREAPGGAVIREAVIQDASVRKYIDLDNPDLPAGLAILQACRARN